MHKRHPILAFYNTPKGFVLFVLLLIALISVFSTKGIAFNALFNLFIGAVTAGILDLIVGLLYTRKRLFSSGGIITGVLVAMVLSSFTPWYIVAATTAIALISKHVLRVKRKPVLNPAAVGLLLSTYLFSSMQSWWGGFTTLPTWTLVFLVAGGILVAIRTKKVPQVLSFLVSYIVMCLIFYLVKQTSTDALYGLENPMLNSALFLGAFMLTDPPTSPSRRMEQVIFGALTGVISVGVYLIYPSELTYLFIGLLSANLYKWIRSTFF